MLERYLLDTCAILWMVNDVPVSEEVTAVLDVMEPDTERLYVSAMSAWEIGMLVAKGRLPTSKDAIAWFTQCVEGLDIPVLAATPEILVASSFLPRPVHNDPADRILIATAREHGLTIITRDRAILSYGALGHVNVLAC